MTAQTRSTDMGQSAKHGQHKLEAQDISTRHRNITRDANKDAASIMSHKSNSLDGTWNIWQCTNDSYHLFPDATLVVVLPACNAFILCHVWTIGPVLCFGVSPIFEAEFPCPFMFVADAIILLILFSGRLCFQRVISECRSKKGPMLLNGPFHA